MLFRPALSLLAGLASPPTTSKSSPVLIEEAKMNTKETKAVAAAASNLGLRPKFWAGGGGFTLYDDGAVAAGLSMIEMFLAVRRS
jgi:hypothetical protein